MHTTQTIFLDFEEPIKEVLDQMESAKELSEKGGVDAKQVLEDLEKKLEEKCREIHDNLTPWQKVQLSRHPERPYTLDYIQEMTGGDFMELHGDRNIGDDKAMIGGFGSIDGQTVMFIGQQKGRKTKQRQMRNFGMANPEGYRKALRLMKLAEKFDKPIVCLIDTPGAYPGLEAEERGQGEAIARNLYEMMILKVPVICVIIGEGASGGALGIGIGDKVLMLENTWYSVISPESCSSILWRSWDFKEQAAEALKLTARNMHKNKLIDGFIKEPLGGAHANPQSMYKKLKTELKKNLTKLGKMKADKRIQERIEKFSSMGVVVK